MNFRIHKNVKMVPSYLYWPRKAGNYELSVLHIHHMRKRRLSGLTLFSDGYNPKTSGKWVCAVHFHLKSLSRQGQWLCPSSLFILQVNLLALVCSMAHAAGIYWGLSYCSNTGTVFNIERQWRETASIQGLNPQLRPSIKCGCFQCGKYILEGKK